MLELLILYSLEKREQTLYGLRKSISEQFGEISNPSHGALHPCIKKLENDNIISVRKKLSDGGRKYTYYSINEGFKEYFNTKFMEFNNSKTETPDAFIYWLKVRLNVVSLIDISLLPLFKEKCTFKLENFKGTIKAKLESAYIELTDIQKELLYAQLQEADMFIKILNSL